MKIYYNPVMKLFGEQFVENFDFEKVSRAQALRLKEVFWFGVYDKDDAETLLKSENKVHLHWAGTDSLWACKNGYAAKLSEKQNITHTAENVMQIQELREFGINARWCPLCSDDRSKYEYTPTEDFRVLVYTPSRHDLYNVPMMVEIARQMPDIEFDFIGDQGALKDLPKNVTNHGWIEQDEVDKLLANCAVYVRITKHDALPNLIIKSMLMGKHVVTNHFFPFATFGEDVATATEAIKRLKENGEDNKAAIWMYSEKATWINNWDKIFRGGQDPTVDIFIVNSRGETEWFHKAVATANAQMYATFRVMIVDNQENEATIGQCYNYAVENSDADYIYFLGDDDYISMDLISSSIIGMLVMKEKRPETVYAGTYVTIVDEEDKMIGFSPVIPTGLWERSWLEENPFREDLARLVDTEILDRADILGYAKTILPYHFGYYYRQHGGMVSGRKKAVWSYADKSKLEKQQNEEREAFNEHLNNLRVGQEEREV